MSTPIAYWTTAPSVNRTPPIGIRALAERLRVAVRRAEPDAIERVRPGWRLIGYDVASGGRTAYFAYVAPEPEHVHLGFEWGALMADPHGRLIGEGITRQVRWLTYRPGDRVDAAGLGPLVREGVRVAVLPRGEKLGRMLDR